MKKAPLILLLLISLNTSAQTIFDYDYVIVPEKFNFQNRKNQYQLNSLLRVLFQEEGFTVLMNTEKKPEELTKNPCLALHTKIDKISAFLHSKFQIKLVDCNNQVIFKSKIGESKSKAYKKGYKEGIKEAFTSIQTLERNKPTNNKKSEKVKNNTHQKSLTTKDEEFTVYKKDGKNFKLFPHADHYELYEAGTKKADIIPLANGNLRYKSKNITGNARFTPQGDLIITYDDADIGKKVSMTFYKIEE